MNYRSNRETYHYYIHLTLIACFAMGLLLSKIILSLSLMALLLNLLILGNFKRYFKHIKEHKTVLWLGVFYLMHLVSLLWSTDLKYGFADARIKIPLLILPLVLSSLPIQKKDLKWILMPFLFVAFCTSLLNYAFYNHWIGERSYEDFREMSLFGSHIRYGLMVSFAIAIAIHRVFTETKYRFLFLLIGSWLIYYSIYSQVLSGLLSLTIVMLLAIGYYLKSKRFKIAYSILLIIGIVGVVSYFIIPPREIDFNTIPKLSKTIEGNPYSSFNDPKYKVNGEPKFVNVAIDELKREWEKHSTYDLFGNDDQHYFLIFTLVKYLDDLNLPKNAIGMSHLNIEDYRNIEKGLSHPPYVKRSTFERLEEIKYQLHSKYSISYSNTLERLIYWKIALKIIQENWIIGVGSGDVQKAFEQQYQLNDFGLTKTHQLRAHQNYLTVWISFGVFGLLLFLYMWYLYIKANRTNFIPIAFISIVLISFLIEDTLETQVGASFVSIFWAIFLSLKIDKTTSF